MGTAYAQPAETGWRGRIWAGAVGRYVLTDNEPWDDPTFGTLSLKIDGSAFGFGGDVEYKFNRRLGIDAALGFTSLRVQFTSSLDPNVAQNRDLSVVPLLFALNIHVVSRERVDIWFGPQVVCVFYGDAMAFPVPPAGAYTYDPENVFSLLGFNFGADIRLSDSVGLNRPSVGRTPTATPTATSRWTRPLSPRDCLLASRDVLVSAKLPPGGAGIAGGQTELDMRRTRS